MLRSKAGEDRPSGPMCRAPAHTDAARVPPSELILDDAVGRKVESLGHPRHSELVAANNAELERLLSWEDRSVDLMRSTLLQFFRLVGPGGSESAPANRERRVQLLCARFVPPMRKRRLRHAEGPREEKRLCHELANWRPRVQKGGLGSRPQKRAFSLRAIVGVTGACRSF